MLVFLTHHHQLSSIRCTIAGTNKKLPRSSLIHHRLQKNNNRVTQLFPFLSRVSPLDRRSPLCIIQHPNIALYTSLSLSYRDTLCVCLFFAGRKKEFLRRKKVVSFYFKFSVGFLLATFFQSDIVVLECRHRGRQADERKRKRFLLFPTNG